jgi:isopentenyldiphosphate isomerase
MSDYDLQLDVINEQGETIRSEPALVVHQQHLFHRAVHAMIHDAQGRWFVRQRSKVKELYPGVWSSSVGQHVASGQLPDEAVRRASQVFLGLRVPLRVLGEQRVVDEVENELVTFYEGQSDRIPSLNQKHSERGSFLTMRELCDLVTRRQTTPHLAIVLEYIEKQWL